MLGGLPPKRDFDGHVHSLGDIRLAFKILWRDLLPYSRSAQLSSPFPLVRRCDWRHWGLPSCCKRENRPPTQFVYAIVLQLPIIFVPSKIDNLTVHRYDLLVCFLLRLSGQYRSSCSTHGFSKNYRRRPGFIFQYICIASRLGMG